MAAREQRRAEHLEQFLRRDQETAARESRPHPPMRVRVPERARPEGSREHEAGAAPGPAALREAAEEARARRDQRPPVFLPEEADDLLRARPLGLQRLVRAAT